MLRASSCSWLNTVTEMGTSCRLSSRRRAVTMISSSVRAPCWARTGAEGNASKTEAIIGHDLVRRLRCVGCSCRVFFMVNPLLVLYGLIRLLSLSPLGQGPCMLNRPERPFTHEEERPSRCHTDNSRRGPTAWKVPPHNG